MEKFYTTLETKATKDDRTVEFIASKEVVDRDGEVIMVKGITTANYKKNPVVLWAHDRGGLPIGKAVSVTKRGDEMKMKVQFATPEEYGFADTVYKLVKGGYLGAVSIGFMPDMEKIEYPDQNKRNSKVYRIFHKVDLLELSVVPVPANQDALSVGKALEDGVIDEVEKKEWDLYCEEAEKTYEGETTLADGSLMVAKTVDKEEFDEIVDEINTRINELKEELDKKKSYLDNIFSKDASAPAKEDQTDEDEFSEEDAKNILIDYGFSEEEAQNFIEEIDNGQE